MAANETGAAIRRAVQDVPHAGVIQDRGHAHALDLATKDELEASVGSGAIRKSDVL